MLTAIEFLEQELNKNGYLNQVTIDKAKEMEKQQMIDFANKYGFHICGYDYDNAKKYYNETFKEKYDYRIT